MSLNFADATPPDPDDPLQQQPPPQKSGCDEEDVTSISSHASASLPASGSGSGSVSASVSASASSSAGGAKGNAPDEEDGAVEGTDAEHMFSQEILRRRISDLSKRQRTSANPKSDGVLDLSLATESAITSIGDGDVSDEEVQQFIESFEKLRSVHVIVFTNRADRSEGVYSLNVAGQNIVLAFEDRSEAMRYSICLQAQDFPEPQIFEMDPKELRDFCYDADLKLGFVPTGMLITPPDESAIDDLDKWSGEPSGDATGPSGLTQDDIDTMRKRFDSLFGQ